MPRGLAGYDVEGQCDTGELGGKKYEHIEDYDGEGERVHSGPVSVPDILGERVAVRHEPAHARAHKDERGKRRCLPDAVSYQRHNARPGARFGGAEQYPGAYDRGHQRCRRNRRTSAVARHQVLFYVQPVAPHVQNAGRHEHRRRNHCNRDSYSTIDHLADASLPEKQKGHPGFLGGL